MAGKTGKIVSLEAIDEHLKRQDKKMNLPLWMTILAPIGFSVFLAGWVGFVEFLIKSNPTTAVACWYLFFGVVMVIGFAVMVSVPLVVWWYNSRIGKK